MQDPSDLECGGLKHEILGTESGVGEKLQHFWAKLPSLPPNFSLTCARVSTVTCSCVYNEPSEC